jgi:hypothetical protein
MNRFIVIFKKNLCNLCIMEFFVMRQSRLRFLTLFTSWRRCCSMLYIINGTHFFVKKLMYVITVHILWLTRNTIKAACRQMSRKISNRIKLEKNVLKLNVK